MEHIQQHFPKIELTTFLKNLLENIQQNSSKDPQGFRYKHDFKTFCAHTYLVSGLHSYEILSKNMGNLPSPVTLNRLIAKEVCVQEGALNIDGLIEYFDQKKYPKIGWYSEDQTKTVERIRYNPKYNTLEGLASPLNENGVPILRFNIAETAADIQNLLSSYPVSTLMNLVLVQPLVENSSAFCLLAYGTDNRFTAGDCLRRWNYIRDTLKSRGFEILGESGDGDSRILKAMKTKSKLSNESFEFDWFHVSFVCSL